jgi:hypothetical protein
MSIFGPDFGVSRLSGGAWYARYVYYNCGLSLLHYVMVRNWKVISIHIKSHGLPLDFNCPAAEKQTTARTILCIRRPLCSPVSTNSEQNIFHSTQRYVPTSEHYLGVSMLTQSTDHVHAMLEPATAPWGLSISDADLEKLKAGFEPQDQDDNGASRPRIRARVAPSPSTLLEAGRARNSTYLL